MSSLPVSSSLSSEQLSALFEKLMGSRRDDLQEGKASAVTQTALMEQFTTGFWANPAQTYLDKNAEQLKKNAKLLNFSDLHIAVICEDLEGCLKLLSNKITDPNAKDAKGWTPLHHAALLSSEKFNQFREQLEKRGADKTLKTLSGDTADEIRRRTTLTSASPTAFTGVYLSDESGTTPLSYEAFEKLTHAKFCERSLASKEWQISEWFKEPSMPEENQQQQMAPRVKVDIAKQCAEQIKNPSAAPKFILKEIKVNSMGKPIPPTGLGVFAKDKIVRGTPLGEYAGYKDVTTVTNLYTAKDGVNAKKFRNVTAQINDGFPNVIHWVLEDGTLVLVAGDDIPADSAGQVQLCSNYGPAHGIKLKTPYIEFRARELRDFVKYVLPRYAPGYDFSKGLNISEPKNLQDEQNVLSLNAKIQYLLSTPSALYSMILEGVLTMQQGEQILNFALSQNVIHLDTPHIVSEQDPKIVLRTCEIAGASLKMREKINKTSSELAKDYYEFISSLPSRFSLITGLHMAVKSYTFFLNELKAEPPKSTEQLTKLWSDFKAGFLKKMGDHYLQKLEKDLKISDA